MGLEALFGLIYVAWGALAVWSMGQLKGFLAETPGIADSRSLERFKDVVRVQMYLALVVIVLLSAGVLVGLVLIRKHGLLGLVGVLGTNLALIGFSLYLKRFEVRARSLPTSSEELGGEYRKVADTWVKKPLPDF